MPTPTIEEYLEVIHMMAAEGQTIKAARLAKSLRVSRPAVAAALRRMARDDLVRVTDSKNIQLTKRGFQTADELQRRHRIVERWLTDVLAFDWAESDAEAHRLEHVMSDEVIKRLNALLGRPATCPHGNPIPGNQGRGKTPNGFPLSQARVGARLKVARISEYAENVSELLRYLGECGLRPGADVVVADLASQHKSLTLLVGGKPLALSPDIAEYVWVRKK